MEAGVYHMMGVKASFSTDICILLPLNYLLDWITI